MWYWMIENADTAGRAKMEAALLRPIPGMTKVSDSVVDFELGMFRKSLGKA